MRVPSPTPDDMGQAANSAMQHDGERVQGLRAQAARCRRLAAAISDRQTTTVLTAMAAEYDEKAALMLEQAH